MNIIFVTAIFIFISASTNAKTTLNDATIEKLYLSLPLTTQQTSRFLMDRLKHLNEKYKFPVYIITSKDIGEYEIDNGGDNLLETNARKSISIDKLERQDHDSLANTFVSNLNEELNDRLFKMTVDRNYNPGQYISD